MKVAWLKKCCWDSFELEIILLKVSSNEKYQKVASISRRQKNKNITEYNSTVWDLRSSNLLLDQQSKYSPYQLNLKMARLSSLPG